jgi:hypothetical protein
MFSVADPGCLSQIPVPNFFHPGSTSKNLSILTQKMVSEHSKVRMIRVFIPGPDPGFFYPSRIPDPMVKKAQDPGSAILVMLSATVPTSKFLACGAYGACLITHDMITVFKILKPLGTGYLLVLISSLITYL